MTKALLAVALLLLVSPAAASAEVDWRQASRCAGSTCAVHGVVAAAAAEGNVVRLYFDKERRDVSVAIVRGWLSAFPPRPDEYYLGKEIVATAPVRSFRGSIEVVVRDRSDIRVIGDAPTAGAAAPDGGAGEQDDLRERLRELERRMDELERRLGK